MASKRKIGSSASEDRLEELIEARLQPGADKEVVDKRIWDLFGERWAVMFTDLSGFSRGVERFGIIQFLQTIYESERLFIPIISDHDGILIKAEGDSILVTFRNPTKALACAIAMQRVLRPYNLEKPDEEKILLCVGLGYGDVLMIGDADVFGAEVNASSKLGEDIAEAGEILITQAMKDAAVLPAGASVEPITEVPGGTKAAYRVRYTL